MICQLSCLMIRSLKDEKRWSSLFVNLGEDSRECEIIESRCLRPIIDAWKKGFTDVKLRILKLPLWVIKIEGLKSQCCDIVVWKQKVSDVCEVAFVKKSLMKMFFSPPTPAALKNKVIFFWKRKMVRQFIRPSSSILEVSHWAATIQHVLKWALMFN